MDVIFLDLYVFDTVEERGAVVEHGVDDDGGGEGKGDEVGDCVGCGEIEVAVVLVCGFVEVVGPGGDDARDVVELAEAVIGTAGGDGKVGEVPGLENEGGKDQ